jgi:hypothetical protein
MVLLMQLEGLPDIGDHSLHHVIRRHHISKLVLIGFKGRWGHWKIRSCKDFLEDLLAQGLIFRKNGHKGHVVTRFEGQRTQRDGSEHKPRSDDHQGDAKRDGKRRFILTSPLQACVLPVIPSSSHLRSSRERHTRWSAVPSSSSEGLLQLSNSTAFFFTPEVTLRSSPGPGVMPSDDFFKSFKFPFSLGQNQECVTGVAVRQSSASECCEDSGGKAMRRKIATSQNRSETASRSCR